MESNARPFVTKAPRGFHGHTLHSRSAGAEVSCSSLIRMVGHLTEAILLDWDRDHADRQRLERTVWEPTDRKKQRSLWGKIGREQAARPSNPHGNPNGIILASTSEPNLELIWMASVPNLSHWGSHGLLSSPSMHLQKQTAWCCHGKPGSLHSTVSLWITSRSQPKLDSWQKPALLAGYPAFVMNPRGIWTHVCLALPSPDTLSLVETNQSEVSDARRISAATCSQKLSLERKDVEKCMWGLGRKTYMCPLLLLKTVISGPREAQDCSACFSLSPGRQSKNQRMAVCGEFRTWKQVRFWRLWTLAC